MLEKGESIGIGNGTPIVLPKPGKPPGEMSSLRPIVLLNITRKTISLITLGRKRRDTERFLSPSQSGFRPGRSTADAVWTHKWLIARANKAREDLQILGVDMSRAFDTINWQNLLTEL